MYAGSLDAEGWSSGRTGGGNKNGAWDLRWPALFTFLFFGYGKVSEVGGKEQRNGFIAAKVDDLNEDKDLHV